MESSPKTENKRGHRCCTATHTLRKKKSRRNITILVLKAKDICKNFMNHPEQLHTLVTWQNMSLSKQLNYLWTDVSKDPASLLNVFFLIPKLKSRCLAQAAAIENQLNLFTEKILSKKQPIPYQEGCTQEPCTIYESDPKAL